MSKGKLYILRHGESEWNATGQWTGLTNIHITKKGEQDAEKMGEALTDVHFDIAYVSEQVRTLETLQAVLKTQGQTDLPYKKASAINERDYGEYTSMNKWQVKDKVGEEKFNSIRRDWDCPIPGGEMLKDVYARAIPFYKETIVPQLIEGKNVLIVAHGNSIRALMKYIDEISDKDIASVEMIFGTILTYSVDEEGHCIAKDEQKIETALPPA
ncbi:MAG: 2,3-bisphosphoglycerate-dependent phosphoglycerate mutase [Candidatus Woesebacteria bacterium]|jgi:2,3-bisphosphoglycerate-dependent phosphoglycerate mutase